MVICVLVGKLLISASENEAGRAAIPSTVTRQSTKPAAWSRLNSLPNGSTSLANGSFRNLGAEKLTGHGMAGQKSLRRVGQRFSRAVKSFRVRRDESIMLCGFSSHGNPRCAGRHSQPRGDQFASRDIAHNFTPSAG